MNQPLSSFRFLDATFLAVIIVVALQGCGGTRVQQRPPANLSAEITNRGQTVYFGSVFPLEAGATEPTYVYERRVDDSHGRAVSTHITRDLSGTVVLADSATHSTDYQLVDYQLHTNQLGQTGRIQVDRDQVTFQLDDGTNKRSRVERQSTPVVVGPTLVGYVVRHLETLRQGEVVPIRFAVLDRLETLGFELRSVIGQAGQTRVKMKPSSLLLAAVVDPIHFTFDTATGKLVRLEGRVPSKRRDGDRWRDFDARVEYRFAAAAYR